MHDHNLDDLIIDEEVTKKNDKTKGILTILALVIVVLIVAIVLTKIILKDPQVDTIVQDNTTQIIGPELTLQRKGFKKKSSKTTIQNDKNISIEHFDEEDEVIDNEDDNFESISEDVNEDSHKNQIPKPVTTKNIIKPDIKKEIKHKKQVKKIDKVIISDDFEQVKEKSVSKVKTIKSKQTKVSEKYYIQVGSFTKTPSGQFLNVIKNSGFNYNLLSSKNGMKKLLIGPYFSRQAVDKALLKVRDRINKGAFVYKVK